MKKFKLKKDIMRGNNGIDLNSVIDSVPDLIKSSVCDLIYGLIWDSIWNQAITMTALNLINDDLDDKFENKK